jgi:hypothetical protein
MVGDDRQRAAGDQELAEGVAVVGRIGSAELGRGKVLDQGRCDRPVVAMAGAQREGERSSAAVNDGVDLGRPAAA